MSRPWVDTLTDTENAGYAVKHLGAALVELGGPDRDFKYTLAHVREARRHIQAWRSRFPANERGQEPSPASDLHLTLIDRLRDAITWVLRADAGGWYQPRFSHHYSVGSCLAHADALLEPVTLWLLAQSRPAQWECKECSALGTFHPGLKAFWLHYRDAHDPKVGLIQSMPRVGGKPFRCRCGANVFTRDALDDTFTCNGCTTVYQGEK